MNAFAARRLSPITDDCESEYGAEVSDIPLYRNIRLQQSQEQLLNKGSLSSAVPRNPQTHELVALVESKPDSLPVDTSQVTAQSRIRDFAPSDTRGSARFENQEAIFRPRSISIDQLSMPTTPRSMASFEHISQPNMPPPGRLDSYHNHGESPNIPSPRRLNFSEYEDQPDVRGQRRNIAPSTVLSPEAPPSEPSTSMESRSSYETNATSLPALQQNALDDNDDHLEPLKEEEYEPHSFDLVVPASSSVRKTFSLEKRSEQLFSTEHLQVIFSDPSLLLRFTSYLGKHRTASIPVLIYYLDALKALKAIRYANAIAEALDPIDGFDFTKMSAGLTGNTELEKKAEQAFAVLVREDLPAFVTHIYIQTVSLSIQRRVTGTLPSNLREASEGLAEVFCLTDPSRPDNPIVFSSEEFHRTTQYGMNYVLGRNCRFLQGPKTNPFSVRRIREKIEAGVEHCECFLNYRRDGSPFMNLLMCAPLCDSRGNIRYFIGAQVDVSGLVKECSDMDSLRRLVDMETEEQRREDSGFAAEKPAKDEFQELSEMLNMQELDTVRKWGGCMHKERHDVDDTPNQGNWPKSRVLITSGSPDGFSSKNFDKDLPVLPGNGRLSGIYEHYLLVRPYPSLRILFASPSLRVPGVLQSPFMNRIGGSNRVREELTQALADGRGVTAKVKWVSKNDLEGRNRWIHCTPLIGSNGAIGVWMVVIVDDEASMAAHKKFKQAPPVDPRLGRTVPISHHNERDWALWRESQQVERGNGLKHLALENGSTRSLGQRSLGQGTQRSGSPYSLRID